MGKDEGWVCDGAEVIQFRTERYGDTVFSPGITQSYFLCLKRTVLLLGAFGRLKKNGSTVTPKISCLWKSLDS